MKNGTEEEIRAGDRLASLDVVQLTYSINLLYSHMTWIPSHLTLGILTFTSLRDITVAPWLHTYTYRFWCC